MNEKLKLVRNLLEKRSAREKEKLFVVEGPHLIEEAGDRVKYIVHSENLPLAKAYENKGTLRYKVSRERFAELSDVENHQGIMAVVKKCDYQLGDVLKGNKTLIVFCIGVQDPGNLGTIIRSADAFGASGVLLSKGTVDLYNPKVIRSTMGSLFHLPVITIEDEEETIEHLKQKGVKIIATASEAINEVCCVNLKGPLAVLVGNEAAGLPVKTIKLADEAVRIPMSGKAESLNAGMAASIVLYEIIRQKEHGR
jgi:TrmH family RNA methyltransferase